MNHLQFGLHNDLILKCFTVKKTSVLGFVPNVTHSYHNVYSRPSQTISFSNYYYPIFTKVWKLDLFKQCSLVLLSTCKYTVCLKLYL